VLRHACMHVLEASREACPLSAAWAVCVCVLIRCNGAFPLIVSHSGAASIAIVTRTATSRAAAWQRSHSPSQDATRQLGPSYQVTNQCIKLVYPPATAPHTQFLVYLAAEHWPGSSALMRMHINGGTTTCSFMRYASMSHVTACLPRNLNWGAASVLAPASLTANCGPVRSLPWQLLLCLNCARSPAQQGFPLLLWFAAEPRRQCHRHWLCNYGVR
jgi:hypothetical protein